jgi:hypothetical protein
MNPVYKNILYDKIGRSHTKKALELSYEYEEKLVLWKKRQQAAKKDA